MSHIPSSVMPHAAPAEASQTAEPEPTAERSAISESARKVTDKAREYPRSAIALGAAAIVGAAAAAIIPFVRSGKPASKGKPGAKRKTTSRAKAA